MLEGRMRYDRILSKAEAECAGLGVHGVVGWLGRQAALQEQEIENLTARIKELEAERTELRQNGGRYLEEIDEMLVAMAEEVEEA